MEIHTKEMVADNANGIRGEERVLLIGLSPRQKHYTPLYVHNAHTGYAHNTHQTLRVHFSQTETLH